MGATNPLENCIIAIRADLENYVTENNDREEVKAGCCLFSMHLAGYSSILAAKKLTLANNVIYTLDQIRTADQLARARFAPYEAHDAAKLAYDAFLQGFARVQNCVEAAIATESAMNVGANGAGRLAPTLQRSLKTFEREWATAKEIIWSMPELQGSEGIFEYADIHKARVLRTFDTDMANKRPRFTAIMPRPANAPPPYQQQSSSSLRI